METIVDNRTHVTSLKVIIYVFTKEFDPRLFLAIMFKSHIDNV